MSDDSLNSARMHLSEAAELAGTMASGFAMKKLTRALNRCNPISVNPHGPQGYAENPFEGGNVGAPAQQPQYSVGSYPDGHAIEANFVPPPPLPVTEYPGDTVPPALPDPCASMREALAACSPPVPYCPSFMGKPTGEVAPLAGQPQPLDTYDSFTNQPLNTLGDPNRSLNDTLRQLWLRNHLQERTQANQLYSNQPRRGDGKFGYLKEWEAEDRALGVRHRDDNAAQPSSRLDMTPQKARTILRDSEVHGHPLTDAQRGMFGAVAGRDDNASYSYPKNPDGRIQGPMQAMPEGDFLGGHFGPGIKRMREQLASCRSC